MKSQHTLCTLVLALLSFATMPLQGSERERIYRAYVTGDRVSWQRTIDAMHEEGSKSNDRIAELVGYEYGFLAICIARGDEETAKRYLKRYKSHVEYLLSANYREAEMTAYLSGYYAYRIGMSWVRLPVDGPKCLNLINKSLKQNSRNAIGLIQKGNAKFYAPSFFGGDAKREAIGYYLTAEQVLSAGGHAKGNWLYLNLITQIADAFASLGDIPEADAWYRKVLAMEPNFKLVRDEKYPAFKAQHNIK